MTWALTTISQLCTTALAIGLFSTSFDSMKAYNQVFVSTKQRSDDFSSVCIDLISRKWSESFNLDR